MISDRVTDALIKAFLAKMDSVTDEYLDRLGERLGAAAKLTSEDVASLINIRNVGKDVEYITNRLAVAARRSTAEVLAVMHKAAEADYSIQAQLLGRETLPYAENEVLQRMLQAQLAQTGLTLQNLSNTTLDTTYSSVVDRAVRAIQAGVGNPTGITRRAIKALVAEGVQVRYPSGHTRRLDTAVKANIEDGVRQLNQHVADLVGQVYGANGVELSAHANCAEDHIDYQGRQYSRAEFEILQAKLERPIGELNCKHFAFPIILGVSQPTHSPEMLKRYREISEEEITINGVTRTRYQWTQVQREIETEVRKQLDLARAAKAADDKSLEAAARARVKTLKAKYAKVSTEAGLSERRDRM